MHTRVKTHRRRGQGKRILLGESFREIASFATGSLTFGRNIHLGADAGISFIVDRFNRNHLDGVTQAFSSVCWTRVYESLREIMSVYERIGVVWAAVHGFA